jgi:hypothetical protein
MMYIIVWFMIFTKYSIWVLFEPNLDVLACRSTVCDRAA